MSSQPLQNLSANTPERDEVVTFACARICRAVEEAEKDINHAIDRFLCVSDLVEGLLTRGHVPPSARDTVEQIKHQVDEIVVSLQAHDLLKQRLWSAVAVLRGSEDQAAAELEHLNRLFGDLSASSLQSLDSTLFATDDDCDGGVQ